MFGRELLFFFNLIEASAPTTQSLTIDKNVRINFAIPAYTISIIARHQTKEVNTCD